METKSNDNDHKKLGKKLGLFAFSNLVGPGLPLFLPKGNVIRAELDNFIKNEKKELGYQFVNIPHIAKKELYEKSGHLGKYDAMMPVMTDKDGNQFVIKAMNCPHHFEIYAALPRTYKELPLRLAENTTVYRNEKSGELQGLTRVMSLTQDDTHHFVRENQIHNEIRMILSLMKKVYSIFGFTKFRVQISVRDSKNSKGYFGNDQMWEKSEKILIDSVKEWGENYMVEEGEAAFYGPKIDIMTRDSLGREWQLATIQLDFNQPDNFDLTFVGEDGQKHRPTVIHVAILGSIERFMGILIEHYAGAFPLWLSPTQVKVLPIGEGHLKYAEGVFEKLKKADIRAELDESNESLSKKIRTAKSEKVPYIIVLGDKEVTQNKATLETRSGDEPETLDIESIISKLKLEIESKK